MGQLMKTEFNAYTFWDLRNGQGNDGSFDPTLYGWRTYGDEGIMNGNGTPGPDRYPVYYSMKLMQYFVRPTDTVLDASSDYLLLSAYAARQTNGSLTLLVINKDAVTNFNGQIALSNFTPASTATVRSYAIPQDEATRTNGPASLQDLQTNSVAASATFNYSFPPYSLTLFTFQTASAPAAPQLQVLPLAAGQFVFQLQGTPNTAYVIQRSADLTSPLNWISVSTNTTLPDGTCNFTNATSSFMQYWRAFWQP